MSIQSSITKLLEKAVGSSALDASILRSKPDFDKVAAANAINSLQRQIDQLKTALAGEQTIQEFEVTSSGGSLIAWIGSKVVGGISYMGAWFRELRIGGDSTDTAVIVADADGNVTIDGASIVIDANGIETIINNVSTPSGEFASLTSQDITGVHGSFTAVTPFSFYSYVWDAGVSAYAAIARLQSAGGAGRVLLLNLANSNQVSLATGGAGSPFAQVTDGTTPIRISPSLGLSISGTSAITAARNGALVDIAMSGNFSGTHAQNVGTGDSPTFADASISGSTISTLVAQVNALTATVFSLSGDVTALQGDVSSLDSRLIAPHDHGAGSFDVGGTPVTGTSGTTSL